MQVARNHHDLPKTVESGSLPHITQVQRRLCQITCPYRPDTGQPPVDLDCGGVQGYCVTSVTESDELKGLSLMIAEGAVAIPDTLTAPSRRLNPNPASPAPSPPVADFRHAVAQKTAPRLCRVRWAPPGRHRHLPNIPAIASFRRACCPAVTPPACAGH